MRSFLRENLLAWLAVGCVLLGGCSKDPVVPDEEIPNIPPSTRTAPGTEVGESPLQPPSR